MRIGVSLLFRGKDASDIVIQQSTDFRQRVPKFRNKTIIMESIKSAFFRSIFGFQFVHKSQKVDVRIESQKYRQKNNDYCEKKHSPINRFQND